MYNIYNVFKMTLTSQKTKEKTAKDKLLKAQYGTYTFIFQQTANIIMQFAFGQLNSFSQFLQASKMC